VTESIFSPLNQSSSSLDYANDIQRIASSVGFDWPSYEGVIEKVREELSELEEEIHSATSQERLVDEFGDLLFSCINLARHLNIEPETALRQASNKFKQRLTLIESKLAERGKNLSDSNLTELDTLWNEVKNEL
jgi:MazG family protein